MPSLSPLARSAAVEVNEGSDRPSPYAAIRSSVVARGYSSPSLGSTSFLNFSTRVSLTIDSASLIEDGIES
jgi:hypothetical protein